MVCSHSRKTVPWTWFYFQSFSTEGTCEFCLLIVTPSYLWNPFTSLHPHLPLLQPSLSPSPPHCNSLLSLWSFRTQIFPLPAHSPLATLPSFMQQKSTDCKWLPCARRVVPSLGSIFNHSAFHLSLPHLPQPYRTSFGSSTKAFPLLAIMLVGLCLETLPLLLSLIQSYSSSRKLSLPHAPRPKSS